jgi:carboxynorspermidine decarboxylase
MKAQVLALAEQDGVLQTPAFVVDEQQMLADAELSKRAISGRDTRLLFAMKSFSILPALQSLSRTISGFHASSLFEAKLARDILGANGLVHVTTPGLRPEEFNELSELCDYISFNSLSQWQAFSQTIQPEVKYGLRINPQLSLIQDARYDPCRRYSKLGVPLTQLEAILRDAPQLFRSISGLLVHSNCDATQMTGLFNTLEFLEGRIQPLLEKLEWLNLGGGYLFNEASDTDKLQNVIHRMEERYELQLLFEPGAAICRKAGYFIATVLDLFDSDGISVAVLDTTVNHMPEVFEYQFEPDIVGDINIGGHSYLLAGSTCLAGDVFGHYAFKDALQVGSRIVFVNAGAYTLVKANMFNGINLPNIYMLENNGNLSLVKHFSYDDYLTQCGVG